MPVRRTTARQPPSGVHAGSPELDCRTLVPSNSTEVLCAPSTSRRAFTSHSLIDFFRRGVNSLESMASLTLYSHGRAASRQEWWFRYYDALGGLWFVYEYKTPSVNTNTHLVTQHLLEEVHQSGPWPIPHHDSIVLNTARSTSNGTPWAFVLAATRLYIQTW